MTRCPFCSRRMPAVPLAIDEGWIPSYWSGEEEIADPVCPACVTRRLRHAEDGEFELAPASPYTPGVFLT